jgi:hypothetical protein
MELVKQRTIEIKNTLEFYGRVMRDFEGRVWICA